MRCNKLELVKLQNWAHKLTQGLEAEALTGLLRDRWAEQWRLEADPHKRETLWIKAQVLNDLLAELQVITEGADSDRE